MSDGSYLLSEHIVVTPRATLNLSAPGGLTLRLASGPEGFSTIVSLGGELQVLGEEGAPVDITSWDTIEGAHDELTTDGRAYIRAIGGQFEASHANLTQLGFWAGRTGGLALTGTDRPNTGAIELAGPGDEGPLSLLDDVTWQPAGPLQSAQADTDLEYTVPAVNYVSSRISNVTVDHNAFGLFVSGANGVQVSDSTFADNQLGGVVFHRYVTNGVISRTTSTRNVGDGFSLDRATTGITISESTASENSGTGFSLDGRPLAEGPSAVGASLRSCGNNSVNSSTAIDNGRYGIELLGGVNLGASNNLVEGHDMGIMVNGPARRVAVTGNTVRDSARHGVALVNGVTDSTVTGNVVEGSATGVYLRDSTGQVKGNTVQEAGSHGVSLVGRVGGSDVSFNVLAGSGASALDTIRSTGEVSTSTNNVDGWHDTTPWYFLLKKLLKPMNALWTALAVLIILSAVRSRRDNGVIEHPYAHQMAHQGILPLPP
ncbi:MAG: right-handed parallel beta-helix repeat-containing protein, partial [Acidimicrobiia bacterium]|nr:right-handed parallel beta-helix repeat-containing protein [Acidimicrobiia bacterium]